MLKQLMETLGEQGMHVMVRYDPLRDSKNFTVLLNNLRLGDTDDPVAMIIDYIKKHSNSECQ